MRNELCDALDDAVKAGVTDIDDPRLEAFLPPLPHGWKNEAQRASTQFAFSKSSWSYKNHDKRRSMPSKDAVLEYWSGKIESAKTVHHCWKCGDFGSTFRCHILAHSEGGFDNVDNLHLLCDGCHYISEYISGDDYWTWFNMPLK